MCGQLALCPPLDVEWYEPMFVACPDVLETAFGSGILVGTVTDEPTFGYLAQGAASALRNLQFPVDRTILLLSYDQPLDRPDARSFFDPRCSWAQGRNRLISELRAVGDLPDYVVFCDDDVVFETGNFEMLESAVAATRPLLGVPTMPKGLESPTFRADLETQRVLALDEQIIVLHRDVLEVPGICPLVDYMDHVSWYVAPLVFEYLLLSRFAPFCHQYNGIVVLNDGHTWQTGGTLYHRGDLLTFLAAWRNLIREQTGSFDSSIVEQFDEQREGNLSARMQSVTDIKPWPGAAGS